LSPCLVCYGLGHWPGAMVSAVQGQAIGVHSSAQQTSYVAGNSVKVRLVWIGLLDKILELNLLAMLVRT